MAISKDLFLALLAMDSYNRGYGSGLADGEGPVDENGIDADGLGGPGSLIGGATVIEQRNDPEAQAAGFYAVAYETDYGTVISYRGTDDVDAFTTGEGASDLWQGWVSGAGVPTGQSALAYDFFEAVTDLR